MHLCVVLFLCVSAQICASTLVFSEDGKHAQEEVLDLHHDINNDEIEEIPVTTSEESQSSEEIKKTKISKENSRLDSSSSSESSEDDQQRKQIKKRSLDFKPELANSINNSPNQTVTKSNNLAKNTTSLISESPNPNLEGEFLEEDKSKEPVIANTESTTQYETETTEETKSEGTTVANEADNTAETEKQTETEPQSETTTENGKTTIENEAEPVPNIKEVEVAETTPEPESTTVTEPGATTEENADVVETSKENINSTTEIVSTSTTEKTPEVVQSSSEDSEDELPNSPSSTPSTEVTSVSPEDSHPKTMMEIAMDRVNKLSDQIRLVLSTYKQVGVVVVPGQSFFPEPMSMQDFKQSFSVGTMDFKNMNVYGLSNFTVEHINTDVDRMQVYILLHMKKLVILGNYTLRTFFSRATGPFNVTLLDVDSEGVAEIQTAPEGHLEAADSEMDMFTKDMRVDFKNLGFMGSMFQGMVSAVGDALFNSIKPQILERVNLVIRTDVNKKLKEFSTKFINKVNPVDLAFSEGRKYCRNNGYDPYHIRDHTFILGGLVYVNITEFWVEGLSRFHRVGNLSLSMDAGVIEVAVHVLTGKLTGHCHWTGQTFGIAKYGKTNFTVDHLQVRAMVHQSLDVRKKPQLNDLDLELGRVKVMMNSPMALNVMIEGIINAFPRLIRHIIVDTLEQPLKEKIQEILDKINVESIVDENLPRLDNFGL